MPVIMWDTEKFPDYRMFLETARKLEQIDVTRLEENVYYAELTIRQGDKLLRADSRPSDAIALGIATSVPIYVASEVLDVAGR